LPDLPKPIFSQVTAELPATPVGAPVAPSPPVLTPPKPGASRMKFVWLALAGLVVFAAAIWAVFGGGHSPTTLSSGAALRTAKVERRDFVRTLRLTGTVEAVQSYTIAAPRLAGQQIGQLVVTRLAPSGTKVHKGDLLVEFDRQDQIKNSIDKRAEYLSFIDQIKKKQADQDAAGAKDDTDLKQAEDALETAKLDVRKNEVVSRIDAEKNKENLDQAEAVLKQLRATYELKRQAAAADLKILEIQRDRSHDAMLFADRNAEKMSITSPLDGLVVLNNIWKGGQMGEVQEGDQVRPGVPFLQVVNPDTMEVRARANQADVPYLRAGQPVEVRLDAYPDLVFKGRLDQIAAIGTTSGMSDKVHVFSVLFSIQGADPKLMPDLSAAVDVELERTPNALVVPRDALISENGQTYVRVQSGMSNTKRQVKVGALSDVEAVIESGVDEGSVVLRGNSS
jgi:HlyD family secretion protein